MSEIVEDVSGPRTESSKDNQRVNVDQQRANINQEKAYVSQEATTRMPVNGTIPEMCCEKGAPAYSYRMRLTCQQGPITELEAYKLEGDSNFRVRIEKQQSSNIDDREIDYVTQEAGDRIGDNSAISETYFEEGAPPDSYRLRLIGQQGQIWYFEAYHLEEDSYSRVRIEKQQRSNIDDQGRDYVTQEAGDRMADNSTVPEMYFEEGAPPESYRLRLIGQLQPGPIWYFEVYHLEEDSYSRVRIEKQQRADIDQERDNVSQEAGNRMADQSMKGSLEEKYGPDWRPREVRSAPTRSRSTSPVPGRTPGRQPSRSPRGAQIPLFNSASARRAWAPSSRISLSPQRSDGLHVNESTHKTSAMTSRIRIAKEKQKDVIKVKEQLERAIQSRQELENKIISLTSTLDEAEVRDVQLERAIHSRQELEDKLTSLTSTLDEAKETVAALQSKTQKLDESLANAQATSSRLQLQLKKAILRVRDMSERCSEHLKIDEKELEALMLAAMPELEVIF